MRSCTWRYPSCRCSSSVNLCVPALCLFPSLILRWPFYTPGGEGGATEARLVWDGWFGTAGLSLCGQGFSEGGRVGDWVLRLFGLVHWVQRPESASSFDHRLGGKGHMLALNL